MGVISRGTRNAFRNTTRTVAIAAILGLSTGLALTMMIARGAVADKVAETKSSIGTTITVSPAGAQGFAGGGEPITQSSAASVQSISHVASVLYTLSDRLTTDSTNLVSAIEAGSLGNRQAGNSGIELRTPPDMPASGTTTAIRTFTPPVIVTGVSNPDVASVYGGSTVSFTAGSAFTTGSEELVAAVGSTLATKNNLSVGSTFTMYDQTITVVGIYDAGTTFANGGLVMPLAAVQKLTDQAGSVTSVTVTSDSLDNTQAVAAAVKTALGDSVDVVSGQDQAEQAVSSLNSVVKIATYSLIGALVAAAAILFMTMMMVVRERRREIGVMKAIGASNRSVIAQFVVESCTLTILGLVVGLIIGVAASSPVTNALVSSTSNSTQATTPQLGGPRGAGRLAMNVVSNVQAQVGAEIVLYGVGVAMLTAAIGSMIPAYLISKVRPADVMRAE